jgi:hypothetical protein
MSKIIVENENVQKPCDGIFFYLTPQMLRTSAHNKIAFDLPLVASWAIAAAPRAFGNENGAKKMCTPPHTLII